VAMGIGAMTAAVMKLPLTSVLLASLLVLPDAAKVMPLVIVAVVVAYVAVAHIGPRLVNRDAAAAGAGSEAQLQAQAGHGGGGRHGDP